MTSMHVYRKFNYKQIDFNFRTMPLSVISMNQRCGIPHGSFVGPIACRPMSLYSYCFVCLFVCLFCFLYPWRDYPYNSNLINFTLA